MYQAIISPHLDYCSSILFLLNSNQINAMQKIVNKAMRSILRADKYTSIRKMCKALSWLNVKERIILNTMSLIFKIYKGLVPNYLCKNIKLNSDVHEHNTRYKNNVYRENVKSKFIENSIYVKGSRIFNRIPEKIRKNSDYKVFRSECCELIKEHKLIALKGETLTFWNIIN